MDPKLIEKAKEQEFFDLVARHRAGPDPGGTSPTMLSRPVAVGCYDTGHQRRYVGYRPIRDSEGQLLVADWRSRAAVPYYRVSPDDRAGVRSRRTFECEGNRILDFIDLDLQRFDADGGPGLDEPLLRTLRRRRDGMMHDIVATIQADQFEVVRQRPDQVLILDGGPGTGKTAIALHRISWLLSNYPLLRGDGVLVVGPHPTFMRYIGQVLPGLGDHDVVHRDLGSLAPPVRRGRTEPDAVARIKGDPRMPALLARALEARIRIPKASHPFATPGLFARPDTTRVRVGGSSVYLPNAEILEALTAARKLELPYANRHSAFRARLTHLIRERSGGQAPGAATVARLADRFWPLPSAPAFLHDLLGSLERLRQAAAGRFTDHEVRLLYRRAARLLSEEVWSEADLPLLDELDYLLNGPPQQYGHVVVDEAQDLSPMQLRSLVRRTRAASMTLIGDLAQSTGPWSRDTWDDLASHLPPGYPTQVQTLRHAYRVPRPAYDLAAKLLAIAAPGVDPPNVVRDGPDPRIHLVSAAARPVRVVAVASEHAAAGRFVGIVCPQQFRGEIEAGLSAIGIACGGLGPGSNAARISLVQPREAKGLEFDAVVVVEPELIVADHTNGHRMLYTALTRTTGHLDIVCTGDPLPLSSCAPPAAAP